MATGFPAPAPAVIPDNGIINAGTPQLLASAIASYIPLDYHEGYIQSWNMALQRQLPKNFTRGGRLRRQPHRARACHLQPERVVPVQLGLRTASRSSQKYNKNTDIN